MKIIGEYKGTLPNGDTLTQFITEDDLKTTGPREFKNKSCFMQFKEGYWCEFEGKGRPPAKSLSKPMRDVFNEGRYIGFLDRFKPDVDRWYQDTTPFRIVK